MIMTEDDDKGTNREYQSSYVQSYRYSVHTLNLTVKAIALLPISRRLLFLPTIIG